MKIRIAVLTALLLPAPAWAAAAPEVATVVSATQDVDAAVAAIEAARAAVPQPDRARGNDPAYIEEYRKQATAALGVVADRIGDLFKVAPQHEGIGERMFERWMIRAQQLNMPDETIEEIAGVIKDHADSTLAGDARFMRANIAINHRGEDGAYHYEFGVADGYVRDAMGGGEKDPERAGWLLRSLGDRAPEGSERQLELYAQLTKEFGQSQSARGIAGTLYQLERVGKPFELAFNDAISGEEVTMASLRGKVVVIDFWATWCGPCVREMPHMKELYERFSEQGVEFVGVSLDSPPEEGGLDKLKAYVAKNEIKWPQYYQGGGWQSEFSSAWKVSSIPAVFVVDADGNLASVNARGRLEEIVPALLAKRAE